MLKSELDYFIENQDDLVKKYVGKTIVIRNRSVIGVFENPLDAYLETKKHYELGTFIIQPCEPGPEAYTVTISSHSVFA